MFAVQLNGDAAVLTRKSAGGNGGVALPWLEDVLRSKHCNRITVELSSSDGTAATMLAFIQGAELGPKVTSVNLGFQDVDKLLMLKASLRYIYHIGLAFELKTPDAHQKVNAVRELVAAFPRLTGIAIDSIEANALPWLFDAARMGRKMRVLHVRGAREPRTALSLDFLDFNPTWCDRSWTFSSEGEVVADRAKFAKRGVCVTSLDARVKGKIVKTQYTDEAHAQGHRRASLLTLMHAPIVSAAVSPCVKFLRKDGDLALRRRVAGFLG